MSRIRGPSGARTELAAILARTHDAVVGSTPTGVINSWNPAAAALYGYPADEVLGLHTQDLVTPERRAEDAQILRLVVAGGGPAERYDTGWVSRDAAMVAVSQTASAIVDAAENVVGVVLVCCRHGAPPEASPRQPQAERARQADADKEVLEAQLQQAQRLEVLGPGLLRSRLRGA